MEHNHEIFYDKIDFVIDSSTKAINSIFNNISLAHKDHNSTIFVFQMPRYIGHHDILLCNKVMIHYTNTDVLTKESFPDNFPVIDMHIDPNDEEKVLFSWRVSINATGHIGSLKFSIEFSCVDEEDVIQWSWNTFEHIGISVKNSLHNSNQVPQIYIDVLEQWKTSGQLKDGYTPVRGIDYWTEQDMNDILSYIKENNIGYATEEYVNKAIESQDNPFYDENGVPKKLDVKFLPDGVPHITRKTEPFLDEITIDSGEATINQPFALDQLKGVEFGDNPVEHLIVTLDSVAYECTRYVSEWDGSYVWGNSHILFDNEDNPDPIIDVPFLIMAYYDTDFMTFEEVVKWEIMLPESMTESSHTLKIEINGGTEYYKLDAKFLPDGVPYNSTSYSKVLLCENTSFNYDSMNEDFSKFLYNDTEPVIGGKYIVTFDDGSSYECVAWLPEEEWDGYCAYLGDGRIWGYEGYDLDAPFLIAVYPMGDGKYHWGINSEKFGFVQYNCYIKLESFAEASNYHMPDELKTAIDERINAIIDEALGGEY